MKRERNPSITAGFSWEAKGIVAKAVRIQEKLN